MLRRMIFPILLGLAGCAVLISLGVWQVNRLAWKEAMLAAIEAKIHDAPVALPASPDPAADKYLPVTVTGQFTGQELFVLAGQKGTSPGVEVIAGFQTRDGRKILVDRGFLPETARTTVRPAGQSVTLTGNLHWPMETDSYTPPPDEKTGLWFARDVPAMAAKLGTEPTMIVANGPVSDGIQPQPVDTSSIPNDHLNYAITWFSLAAVWAGMTVYLLWRIRRRTAWAPPSQGTSMRYISTRGSAPVLGFGEAMMTGLARDGGLYVPETVPQMAPADIAAMAGLPYEEVAFRVMKPFVGGFFTDAELQALLAKAYAGFGHAARAPLKELAANHFLLELFHGPTLAFKDFAMQIIGQMMQAALARTGDRITIVGATSGDTGSAAIEAFRGLANVDVFILFPHGRVSDVQRRQMTTPTESNVHALAIDGSFDDAQARLKDMFNDFAFRDGVRLAGVNSINWARVLAQVVYYFYAAVALGAPHRAVSFTVPTGNFGDIFAGYIAKQMGLPIDKLVIATNQNDILDRALKSGRYATDGVRPSISPSMDIQVSSNFERALFDAYGRDGKAIAALMEEMKAGGFAISQGALETLRATFASGRASEEETLETIQATLAQTGELLCPHSAVGVHVAGQHLSATPMITLATAHPAKFPDAVERASGIRPGLPPRMADLFDRPERVTRVPNDLPALMALVRERTGR